MIHRNIILGFLLAGAFLVDVTAAGAGAVRGVTDTEVKIGFLTDVSGPGKFAGPANAMGGQIYMDYINDKGGNFAKVSEPTFPDGLVFAMWPYCAAMVEGLKKAGRDLTPESLIKGLESIKDLDMGGLSPKISFTPKRHVGYFSTMVLRAGREK